MTYRIYGIHLALGTHIDALKKKLSRILRVPLQEILTVQVVRRSLDARRMRPHFVFTVDVSLQRAIPVPPTGKGNVHIEVLDTKSQEPHITVKRRPDANIVVIGCGPAGLFASLVLARAGIPPLLLERGNEVTRRVTDVQIFWEKGILNPESNVHFGEGGAGTFSDGKLTSRVKNPFVPWVKRVLVDAGAPSEILIDAKPHIGTDRLREVVRNLRTQLLTLGCEVRFNARVTDMLIHRGVLKGIVVNGEKEIEVESLVLATGQSAEDTYRMLYTRGVGLIPKPFAMGLRVEHPQEVINALQYGKWKNHPDLPPAEYFLTARSTEMQRSVYTFCMCPGGKVIGCSSEEGGVVTNGMSMYMRDGRYANSAIVVSVNPDDFTGVCAHPLSGIAFRRSWEEKAYILGGSTYRAPAQGLVDFLCDREGELPHSGTFLPGVTPAPLACVLPDFVVRALKEGILHFDKKMPGFLTAEALLVGVETRTSSPVRIVRRPDGQSEGVAGLYPCGEGAGYAGGIISSALDGVRIAEHILRKFQE